MPVACRPLIEIARQDQFQHPVIGSARKTESQPPFDRPRLAGVVEDSEELVLLLGGGIEAAQWAEIIVLLGGDRPGFAEIVGHPGSRREVESTESLVGIIEDRIDDHLERTQMPADDGADLLCVAVLIPVSGVVTELEVDAVKETLIGGIRFDE